MGDTRSVRMRRVGLVEALAPDGSGRVYAAGRVPDGRLLRELGALRDRAGADTRPVWITDDGRLCTEDYAPRTPGPPRAARLRWMLAPLRWRDVATRGRRLATVAWRARHLRSSAPPPPPRPSGPPSAHVSTRPILFGPHLHAGVHPITGHQRLGGRWELVDAGYHEVVEIGWLENVPAVTGEFDVRSVEVPWESRLGKARAGPREDFSRPAGSFVGPFDDGQGRCPPLIVEGWAYFPDQAVSHVEMSVNGRPVGRARTGYHASDLARVVPAPDASIAGWEFLLHQEDAPAGASRVELGATVHGTSRGRIEVDPLILSLDSPPVAAPVAPGPAEPPPRARSAPGWSLRLLAFTHDLGRGGAQLFFVELLRRLVRELGAECTVVSPRDGSLREPLEAAGICVHVSPGPAPEDPAAVEGRLAERVAWAADRRFDVALVNSMVAFEGVAVAERLGIPSVFWVHESLRPDEFWAAGAPAVRARVRTAVERALASADLVLFEARATRDLLAPWGRPERFVALPYAIELDDLDEFRSSFDRRATRRRLGLPEDAPVVLCLGTIEPRKGQVALLRAFHLVAERHPDARLALVGLVDWEWTRSYSVALRQYVARSGLSPRTLVTELDDRPYDWLAAADLLVCPSDVESLPRVALEAMAIGTPVLATRAFGLVEAIDDGVTGYLCEPRDVGDLARALDRALRAPADERRRIAGAASARVRERHDPARYATRVAEIVSELAVDPTELPVAAAAAR